MRAADGNFINSRDGTPVVRIEPGWFVMGVSGKDGQQVDAHPAHRVWLDGFWIYKFEVSRAQYERFLADSKRNNTTRLPASWTPDLPITNVTWDEAMAYCAWAGGSLPSEAQWERAARGTDERRYTWGNSYDRTRMYDASFAKPNEIVEKLATPDENGGDTVSFVRPLPVDSLPGGASPAGAHHMLGNVSEWCRDFFDPDFYSKSAAVNPVCLSQSSAFPRHRVKRGGSHWSRIPKLMLTTYARIGSAERSFDLGFRCVLPLVENR